MLIALSAPPNGNWAGTSPVSGRSTCRWVGDAARDAPGDSRISCWERQQIGSGYHTYILEPLARGRGAEVL